MSRSRQRVRLYGPTRLAASPASLYTVPAGRRAAIRNVYLNNPSGALRKVTMSIGQDAAATRFLDLYDVPAGESVQQRMRHLLEGGELIQGYADASDTVVAIIDGYLLLLSDGGPSSDGFPDETNTGTTGALTPVSGDLTINVNGTTVENQERTGSIVVNANNVTIRNCKIIVDGGTAIENNGLNLLVEDCEIDLGFPVSGGTGIESGDYTALRCNIYGGENLLWAELDTLIEDCYLHDIIPYDEQADPHTDGVQMPTPTSNVTIRHNTIYGNWVSEDDFGNSAITSGESTDVLIDNNLLAGGGYTLYCPSEPGGFEWRDNRFSTIFTPTVGGFGPVEEGFGHTNSGNVIHETDEPVP